MHLHRQTVACVDDFDKKRKTAVIFSVKCLCTGGGAIFFSTHVLEVAEKLCDKVAIIKAGSLIRSGTMDEVKGDDSLEEVFLELEGEGVEK